MKNNLNIVDQICDGIAHGALRDQVREDGRKLELIPEAERDVDICIEALNQNALAADFVPAKIWTKLKDRNLNVKKLVEQYFDRRHLSYSANRNFKDDFWVAKSEKPLTSAVTVNNIKQINRALNAAIEKNGSVLVSHTYTEGVRGGIVECELAEKRTRRYLASGIKLVCETSRGDKYITLMLEGRNNGPSPKRVTVEHNGWLRPAEDMLAAWGGEKVEVPHNLYTEVLPQGLRNLIGLARKADHVPEAIFCGHEALNCLPVQEMRVEKNKITIIYNQWHHGYAEITIEFDDADKAVIMARSTANLNHAGTHDQIALKDAKAYEKWQQELGNPEGMIHWDKKSKRPRF